MEIGHFAFLSLPPFEGLTDNVQCSSLLFGKRVVVFLLVLIELFR